MSDRIDFDKLDRHLSGETPAASDDQATRRVADVVTAALRAERGEPWDTDRSLEQLKARMGSSVPRRRWIAWTAAAAAVLVVAIGGLLARREVATRTSGLVARTIEYRTGTGERRTVRLPDSSTVTLAPASVLRAPATFAQNADHTPLRSR